ncbi:hypothetical protein SSE37_09863 [Sagittula stellata E-37]|uniref:DUF58 domain-containing protein n=1 Tax=Sagittula stellata (strain ATCC 700073 / DSM 11524 / E-37) TaxID=388399 RepID=A3K873_SAGS3|nr:hypothetical protein SSE37_09863 [Sagittula stellata E-37]
MSLDRLVALAGQAGPVTVAGLSHGRVAGLSGPRRGEGGDLYDLRPFIDGDDPRLVDPAASARSGRPQLRRRHEEVERSVLLIVDFRAPMFWGTRGRFRSVAAAEAAALEGWVCVRAGGRVGLAIIRDDGIDRLPARPREAAMLEIAGTLARTHEEAMDAAPAAVSLSERLGQIAGRLPSGMAVLLATGLDDPGDGFFDMATDLMRRNPFEILLVQDAVETAPPPGRFAARIGDVLSRGRFGVSPTAAVLSERGIAARIVRAEADEVLPV